MVKNDLIPEADVTIFDETHQLPDITVVITLSRQLLDFDWASPSYRQY